LTVRRGYEFNYRLHALQVEAHEGLLPAQQSFVEFQGSNVVLTALKKAEDGDGLVMRFYEWAGQNGEVHIRLPQGSTKAQITNLLEDSQGVPLALAGDQITVPVHPYEIVSVHVDYTRRP
jgi:alpha-mannosidase